MYYSQTCPFKLKAHSSIPIGGRIIGFAHQREASAVYDGLSCDRGVEGKGGLLIYYRHTADLLSRVDSLV